MKRKGFITSDLANVAMGIAALAMVVVIIIYLIAGMQTAATTNPTTSITNESITGIMNNSFNTTSNTTVISITSITNANANTTWLNAGRNYTFIAPNNISWISIDTSSAGNTAYVSYVYSKPVINANLNASLTTSITSVVALVNWLPTIIIVLIGAGLLGLVITAFSRFGGGGLGGL